MIEKFKNLTKWKKILISIIAMIFLPIVLLVLSANLLVKGIKGKKIIQIVCGSVLTSVTLFFALIWLLISTIIFSSSDSTYEVDSELTKIDIPKEEEPEEEVSKIDIPKEEVSEKEVSKKLTISIKETMETKDGKVRFNITTNIPDSAELMIGLSGLDNNDYKGQTKATVKNGKAQTEWFSSKGNALTDGKYELSISMSMPKLQTQAVQDIVGVNGEFMEGKYVEKLDDLESYFISKVTTITLTGGASAEKKVSMNEEHKQVVSKFYNELKNEYTSQLGNYNESDFNKFRADWNRRRNEAQAKMNNEEPLMKYSIAMGYLPHLLDINCLEKIMMSHI